MRPILSRKVHLRTDTRLDESISKHVKSFHRSCVPWQDRQWRHRLFFFWTSPFCQMASAAATPWKLPWQIRCSGGWWGYRQQQAVRTRWGEIGWPRGTIRWSLGSWLLDPITGPVQMPHDLKKYKNIKCQWNDYFSLFSSFMY